MKVICIDDHGNTREFIDDNNPVMEAAKDHVFYPCPNCGMVCFIEDMHNDVTECVYCNPKI